MNLLTVENIAKSYGEKTLFQNLTFGIGEGERIGLIGVNGTGKSTLLKIIAGITEPDDGRRILNNQTTIGFLSQNPVFNEKMTILEQVMEGLSWEQEPEAKTILTQLGMCDFEALISQLSGGQKKRVALARTLIQPTSLLILDEPTNHIDHETIEWLEDYLKKRKSALLLITHDRYFLNRVANRIIELDEGRLYSYEGNYELYLEKKAEREELAKTMERKHAALFKNELAWIRRGAQARSTKQKARIQRFEKLEAANEKQEASQLEIALGAQRLGKKVLELKGITKTFGEETLIRDFTYTFVPGEKVGIVGKNGAGKSTLLNLLSGKLVPDKGQLEVGQTVKISYYDQESNELDGSLRVIDYIKEAGEYVKVADGTRITASQMLERFLFPSGVQWTPIASLSGGEKRRLHLLRKLMEEPNVLLLDEPTNDLDIQTLTILEDYLDHFAGTLVVVSHDRFFLDRMADHLFIFEKNGLVMDYHGTYSAYIQWRKNHLKQEAEPTPVQKNPKENDSNRKARPKKLSFKDQREYDSIEGVIASLEEKIEAVQVKVNQAGSDYGKLQDLLQNQHALEAELEKTMERWMELIELVEEIERES